MNQSKQVWNENLHKDILKINNKLKVYDFWLDKFNEYIVSTSKPIVDLGCGIGNDTLYLINKGKDVLSVDFSEEGLEIIKNNIPESKVKLMDIANNYSLAENSADLIIANLSLHYFDEKTTFNILNNIRKTLTDNGTLIFRVNSINDKNYGADNNSIEIEKHYYKSSIINKRFFDKEDIKYFFKGWNILYCQEEKICTSIHQEPKVLWECVVKK